MRWFIAAWWCALPEIWWNKLKPNDMKTGVHLFRFCRSFAGWLRIAWPLRRIAVLVVVMVVVAFLPEASMAIGYCRCLRLPVRPCVNHLLVRAITRDPFKPGSPNLNHRCKRPWLRSLLFWGWLTFTFKVKFTFEIKFTPFSACPCANSSSVQARAATKFGPDVQNALIKIPIFLGVDWAWNVKFKVLLQWNSTSVYTSCTYSTYHLELALGTFICHFISACLVCHTS